MKVLISAHTGLGNFILKIPMIEKIVEIYPQATVDIITGLNSGDDISEVAGNMKCVRNVYPLSNDDSFTIKYRFFKRLREEEYDVFFLPFDSMPRSHILGSYIARIPMRVLHGLFTLKSLKQKFRTALRSLSYPNTIQVPILQGRHEIDINYDLLEAYYNKPMDRVYQMSMPYSEDKAVLLKFGLKEKKYIVLQTGARNGIATPKTWDPKNFVELIKEIQKKYAQYQIVTVGCKSDYESGIKEIVRQFPHIINTAGLTTINELVNILSFARFAVTHDSGVMHVANALGIDLVALYGPTDYTRTRPLGGKSHILYSQNTYLASMYNLKESEDGLSNKTQEFECMNGIKITEVLNEIDSILNEKCKEKEPTRIIREKHVHSYR
jgi:lipopolysaccharide heptosyltransferase II